MQVPHYVYILEITSNIATVYKIGYSSNIQQRMRALRNTEKLSSVVKDKGIAITGIRLLAFATLPSINPAKCLEAAIHTKYSQYRYRGKKILPNGNTELFTDNIAAIELADIPTNFRIASKY